MAPPRPRSKRTVRDLDDEDQAITGKKRVIFKGEPAFYDDGEDFDEEAHGIQMVKRVKVGSANSSSSNGDCSGFGPHIIKMGQDDKDILDRVASKYKKMGHTVQLNGSLIKLNVIKADGCLQEEIMEAFPHGKLEHTDMTLVSATEGQDIPCHKFILAVRSPVFKRLFSSQPTTTTDGLPAEPMKEVIDASTEALKGIVYIHST